MKLEQLRALVEIVRHDFSVSRAAGALDTPQSVVSRHLRALERELGVDVFVRRQKRLRGFTKPGAAIVELAQRMLTDAENLTKVARDFSTEDRGRLAVAATHTQARYALPPVVQRFSRRYPHVQLVLHQGNPAELSRLVREGEADLFIGSDPPLAAAELVVFNCYSMNLAVLTPPGHPLLKARPPTLKEMSRYPIITYDNRFIGRTQLTRAFEEQGLVPNIVLSAIDTDVIKTYVELGLGIGIVAQLAFDRVRDKNLRAIDARHLFEPYVIHLGVRRNDYLRGYMLDFIEMFAPHLTREIVTRALRDASHDRDRRKPKS